MKDYKKVSIYLILILLFLAGIVYCAFLFIVPAVFNTKSGLEKAEQYICKKNGICVAAENFRLKTTPDLLIKLNSEDIHIQDIFLVKNLSGDIDLKNLSAAKLKADYIFVNGDKINNIIPKKKKAASYGGNVKNIPAIEVKKIEYKSNILSFNIRDLQYNKSEASFYLNAQTRFLQKPIYSSGSIYVDKDVVFARNIIVASGDSKIYLAGKLFDNKKRYDFTLKGNGLAVNDIEKSLLYYQKSQDPAKKFIENFVNYSGKIDIDLNVKNSGIFGICRASKLSANAVWFNIPVYFEEAVFKFSGKSITSVASGFLGEEKVVHTLNITNLGSSDKSVVGTVNAVFHDSFNYIPNLKIVDSANARLVYKIRNKKVDIVYFLDIKEGSDLFYKNANLGLKRKKRRFMLHTYKDCDNLHIKKYEYSLLENSIYKSIMTGDGLFIKQDNHMVPQYITYKTNGYAPVSVIGPLGKYVEGGAFSGDLKYDFIKNQVFGSFELIHTRFKNFYVESAKIIADLSTVKIKAFGTYDNEKFACGLEANNELGKKILIYNMKLFLDKFVIKNSSKSVPKLELTHQKSDIASKIQDADITIENWEIKLNQIKKDRIVLNDIKLLGSLKDDIFRFWMPELEFAHGILAATGKYNFVNDSSCIDFNAKNINSNMVADIIFGLPNQVEGIADAKLHLDTLNKLENIKARGSFEVKQGFLPQLGNTEFMIKKSRKYKVSDIVNLDFSKKNILQSNIKGSFVLDNTELKDVEITSQQKYLSLLLEGNYDTVTQYANLNVFGKYNQEAPKGIKILFVPLNWILKIVFRPENSMCQYADKIKRIPPIERSGNEKYFRVKMFGNINSKNMNVEIKGIK